MPDGKRETGRLAQKVFDWIGYIILIGLFALTVLVIQFPKLEYLVDSHSFRAGILAALLAFLIYYDKRISKIASGNDELLGKLCEQKEELIRSGSIYDLVDLAMPFTNRVKKLRIFALNTEKIFPAFFDNTKEFHADKVFLLIQSSEQSKHQLEHWKGQEGRRIGKLEPAMYEPLPSSYYMIFDDECLILGGYYPANNRSGGYFIPPFLIRDGEVIRKYIHLHEKTMEFHLDEAS